ncbi:DUF2267 domain-containing protein [Halolamina salifodinae]|uniref:Uncharacterized protein (DUF2267 family) n=1 Tax=Halolamina salifodinae TaxID=1202767 RepID=A0A8T4GZ83_9EURY|nr:DUF2267 domain-containing protein [Halolamina salifodinae]MBP1988291.1 uncharacterized protein (DUF2267 family) [Halolamina salifodinae]
MTLQASIIEVQRQSDVDDDETAEETLRETLDLLAERISREEGKNIAGKLPKEMETWAIDWDSHSEASFGVDEFLERLADRLGVDKETAQTRAQAAFDALEMETDHFERSRIEGQLPDEYDTLI